jgi:transcriptional regulator with XRE-family HTH domain
VGKKRHHNLNTRAFADKLRQWLERNNQTQNDLARRMDIANATVSQWLSEEAPPGSIHMLVKLEEATGIDRNEWMGLLTDLPAPVETPKGEARASKRKTS